MESDWIGHVGSDGATPVSFRARTQKKSPERFFCGLDSEMRASYPSLGADRKLWVPDTMNKLMRGSGRVMGRKKHPKLYVPMSEQNHILDVECTEECMN